LSLPFVKMQAQGNDFVILDAIGHQLPDMDTEFVKKICHRHFGIGCDQLLILQTSDDADAWLEIYNADGSSAANCGNGLRCVAALLMSRLACEKVSIGLADRVIHAQRTKHGVQVNMGKVVVEQVHDDFLDVNMGNPHRVSFAGEILCPERNVEIVSSYNQHEVFIRIIERGTGETLACGSGACASAIAVWKKLNMQSPLTVHMPGGDVVVSMENENVLLEGAVQTVFSGEYCLS